MKLSNGPIRIFWVLFLTVLGIAKAEIVYDNTTGGQTNFYLFSHQYGDDINLAGQSRSVTEFVFMYFGDLPANVASAGQWQIRFYRNDGELSDPTSTTSQRPGSLLWESAVFPVLRGYVTNLLAIPNINVPDRFTWTVEFSGLPQQVGNGAGLVLANPPTIGALLPGRFRPVIGSYSDYWVMNNPNDTNSWALNIFSPSPDIGPQGNFYARVGAVPEPTVITLGVLGAGCAVWMARRSRRS